MSEDLRIRAADLADLDDLSEIHTRARASYYRGHVDERVLVDPEQAARRRDVIEGFLYSPDQALLCAELDGRLVGFTAAGPSHDPDADPARVGELYSLYVAPPSWRRGIGGELLRAAVSRLRVSFGYLTLWVWEHNARARSFFAARGWWLDEMARRADCPSFVRYQRHL